MVKVITNGVFVGRRLTCPVCGCVFEIQAGDNPSETLLADTADNRILAVYFRCPQCNSSVPVENEAGV